MVSLPWLHPSSRIIALIINVLLTFKLSSAVILFTDIMDSHNTANWPSTDIVGSVKFGQSNNCPPPNNCCRLSSSVGTSSIISSTIDATNFKNIHLQYGLQLRGAKAVGDHCTVYYSIDNGANWQIIKQYSTSDDKIIYPNEAKNLTDASNISGIKLYILQEAADTNNRCFLANFEISGDAMPTTAPTTMIPTTSTPTTNAPTTDAPTTAVPTTDAPTTNAPTTNVPTTNSPTSNAPTTDVPTTISPTTNVPTTSSPTTNNPTTSNPTTIIPTTQTPTTSNPTTISPTTVTPTNNPTTNVPTTHTPTTATPTNNSPTTSTPTSNPVTISPTSSMPTTNNPTTSIPTTKIPTTSIPTTYNPTTNIPTTINPTVSSVTTSNPTTAAPTATNPVPTSIPTTSNPTTSQPTKSPITTSPTTNSPSTSQPTPIIPTTNTPTTNSPSTIQPTTTIPTTVSPTHINPTTNAPTATSPTPSTPTTSIPTTNSPSTTQPTTYTPTSSNPTTVSPTPSIPTTSNPTTLYPTTVSPTTINPTTVTTEPTTISPSTTNPTTNISPTTTSPTPSTANPTTNTPTTSIPTTAIPTTLNPTTNTPTSTVSPTPINPTTNVPTTTSPTPLTPTTSIPTTYTPTSSIPTTSNPTTLYPTTVSPTTINPTTITTQPTTISPTTINPTTNIPTTTSPTPSTSNPTTNTPTTSIPTTAIPTTLNPSTNIPTSTFSPTLSPETNSPTINPTQTVTIDSDSDDNTEQSQLILKESNGECNFTCWECLQQVDITGHGGTSWDLLFNSYNRTNCSCPNQQGQLNDENENEIKVGENDPMFRLEVEKYEIPNDDGITEFGLRVNVLYWDSIPQTCTVSYFVNQNEFFGVQAQNILTISFTVCNIDLSNYDKEAKENEYNQLFAALFEINLDQINATIELGHFCDERRRRNLLQNDRQDEDVTVVIIFHDADDAKAAKDDGCDLLATQRDDVTGCDTQVHSADEINKENEVAQTSDVDNNNSLLIGIIVITVVLFTILILFVFLCYFSYRKKRKKQRLQEEYEKVRKQSKSNTRTSHTDSVTSSLDGRVTSDRRNSHERIKSEKFVTFTPTVQTSKPIENIEMCKKNSEINNSNNSNQKHFKFMDSIQINLDVTIRLNELPTNQEGKLDILEEQTNGSDMEIMIAEKSPFLENNENENENENENGMDPQEIMEQLMEEREINSKTANEINEKDLIIDCKIGHGHFGDVYKAIWEGNLVVLKQLKDTENGDKLNEKKEELKHEIILATSLPPHQNLVEVFGYVLSPMFGIVMRYMRGNSVEKYVYRKYKLINSSLDYNYSIPNITELLIILTKSACGFKFLHEYGLIHRDIACRNILLGNMNNNHIDITTEVRVSDFGLSRQLKSKQNQQKSKSNFGPIKWMSPESIKEKIYSKSSDVYMFGCTMWEIFYGMEPYGNENNITNLCIDIVNNQKRPIVNVENNINGKYKHCQMPKLYKELMELCWQGNANHRPTFQEIIKLITKIDGNPIQSNAFWD